LRSRAQRDAPRIGRYGWRPSKNDLTALQDSTADAIAYRITARAWRQAGFKIAAIRKLAKRRTRRSFALSVKAPVPHSTMICR
jgi:hypothetical protein